MISKSEFNEIKNFIHDYHTHSSAFHGQLIEEIICRVCILNKALSSIEKNGISNVELYVELNKLYDFMIEIDPDRWYIYELSKWLYEDKNLETETIKKLAFSNIPNKEFTPARILKKYFHNSALVLKERGYPKIKDCIPEMLEWFMDINWPGALIVLELAKTIPRDEFISHYVSVCKKAYEENDDCWLGWLGLLIDHFEISEIDFDNKEVYNELLRQKELNS